VEQGMSVLPKSYCKERIIENSEIFDWQLTDEDHERIATIEQRTTLTAPFVEDGTMISNVEFWDVGH
jgi:diketogulonate reductase-like aldo/keto reductase